MIATNNGKLSFGERTVPFALFWVVLLSYGFFLGWFGFYGDDWSYVWYHHLLGYTGPGVFAAIDRPLSAGFYNPVITLFGEMPLPYHILNLALRWLSAVLLYNCIKLLWKNKTRMAMVAAGLFVVYPGFTQQPIAVEFILHFAVLDLFLLSLILMFHAQRGGKLGILLTVLNMAMSASMFWLEYFVGLELLRPFFIWAALKDKNLSTGARLRRTLLGWIPNLLVLGGFLYWRVFIFTFKQSYKPELFNSLVTSPLSTLSGLLVTVARDLKTVVLDSWMNTVHVPSGPALPFYLGLVLIALATLLFYLISLHEGDGEGARVDHPVLKDTSWQAIGLGIFAMLAAGWVFWVTGIAVEASFPWDRTTLSFMPGVSLLIAGVLDLLLRPRWQMIAAALLISLAVGFHFQNAQVYRAEWLNTQAFFWQLSWRAPGLQPATLVAGDDIPLYRVSDAGLNAPLNWMYSPAQNTRSLPYRFFDLTIRMGTEYSGMPGVKPGLPIKNTYRSLTFKGTTENTLLFDYKIGSCLHVLAPGDKNLPGLPQKTKDLAQLANPKRIIAHQNPPALPPAALFPEPAHDWCYYYEKAALAAQNSDWQQVAALGADAEKLKLIPQDPAERLPFIRGYIALQQFDQANSLSDLVCASDPHRPALCAVWKQAARDVTANADLFMKVQSDVLRLGCADLP
jgi:hypothetical protein